MFFKDKELTENVEQLKYMIDEINEKIRVFSNANATTRIDHTAHMNVNDYTFRTWDHLLPIYIHPTNGYRMFALEDIEFLKKEKDANRLVAALDALKNKRSTLNPEAK